MKKDPASANTEPGLAHSAGFEPATPGSVDRCSIQLSYECKVGGEGGIRTHDEVLPHTPLAGERLQPLGHLSNTLHIPCNIGTNHRPRKFSNVNEPALCKRAEEVGFEPTVRGYPTTVFKTAALSHSATPPWHTPSIGTTGYSCRP